MFKNYLQRIKDYVIYNHNHRNQVCKLEKEHKGKLSLLTRLHDIDKVILVILGFKEKTASKIHRIYSWHHMNNKIGWLRIDEMILDWEACRYTKQKSQLNAYDFCRMKYPHMLEVVESRLEVLNIKK